MTYALQRHQNQSLTTFSWLCSTYETEIWSVKHCSLVLKLLTLRLSLYKLHRTRKLQRTQNYQHEK